MRTLAIIPARGQSKRIPRKNVRDFLGLPLIVWSIRFARAYPRFDTVLVSTDSPEIAEVSRAAGLDVPHLRPAALATDTAGSADVALHILQEEELAGRQYDAVALLQPTSPIRKAQHWDAAYRLLESPDHHAVIGMAPVRDHPFHGFALGADGQLTRFVPDADLTLRSQDLPPAHAVAGNLYLIRTTALRQFRTFFPPRTTGVICAGPCEALDIDTEEDWVVAEALAKYYGLNP